MLVRALRIKYIRNIEVYFVGCLYSLDLIHARKTEHIKIYQDVFQYHRIQRRRIGNSLLSLPRSGHTGGSVYGRWYSGPVVRCLKQERLASRSVWTVAGVIVRALNTTIRGVDSLCNHRRSRRIPIKYVLLKSKYMEA